MKKINHLRFSFSFIVTTVTAAIALISCDRSTISEPVFPETIKNSQARVGSQGVLFTALNNNAKIYRNSNGNSLGTQIYNDPNNYFTLKSIAVGDVDGDGTDEFFSLFNSSGGPRIYRNEDGNSIGGIGGALIYNPGTSTVVYSITTADTDGDGKDELYTSMSEPFYDSNFINIYKSDGTGLGNRFNFISYFPPIESIALLTSGDIDQDSKEDVIISTKPSSSSASYSIFKITSGTRIELVTGLNNVTALASGDFNNDGRDEIFIGTSSPSTKIYKTTYTGIPVAVSSLTPIYTDPNTNYFINSALGVGDVDGDNKDELFIGFTSSVDTRVYKSEDGNYLGATGIFYSQNDPSNTNSKVAAIAISKY